MINRWGYTTDGPLPPLMDEDAFHRLTSDRFRGAEGVEDAINAASAAVRDWCGWHVAPIMSCSIHADSDGGLVRLPAMCVHDVRYVKDGDTELPHRWSHVGLIRGDFPAGWAAVDVAYTAGVDDDGLLAYVASSIVSKMLGEPSGVKSESIGGQSVTYEGGQLIGPGAAAFLSPYRVRSL